MKSILLTIIAFFGIKAQAHEFHTPNYCHSQVQDFCAHIGYSAEPELGQAFEFVVDIVAPESALNEVKSAEVTLWMPEINQSSFPVKVERLDLKHFRVTEAYFVMQGEWLIQVDVATSKGPMRIEIPMEIK